MADNDDWPADDGDVKKNPDEAAGALTKQNTESDLSKAGAGALAVDEDER